VLLIEVDRNRLAVATIRVFGYSASKLSKLASKSISSGKQHGVGHFQVITGHQTHVEFVVALQIGASDGAKLDAILSLRRFDNFATNSIVSDLDVTSSG